MAIVKATLCRSAAARFPSSKYAMHGLSRPVGMLYSAATRRTASSATRSQEVPRALTPHLPKESRPLRCGLVVGQGRLIGRGSGPRMFWLTDASWNRAGLAGLHEHARPARVSGPSSVALAALRGARPRRSGRNRRIRLRSRAHRRPAPRGGRRSGSRLRQCGHCIRNGLSIYLEDIRDGFLGILANLSGVSRLLLEPAVELELLVIVEPVGISDLGTCQ